MAQCSDKDNYTLILYIIKTTGVKNTRRRQDFKNLNLLLFLFKTDFRKIKIADSFNTPPLARFFEIFLPRSSFARNTFSKKYPK